MQHITSTSIAALFICLGLHSLAYTQVLRCTDAEGRISYTNTACPQSQAIQEVVPAISAQEAMQMQMQYEQALQHKKEELEQQAQHNAAHQQAEAARQAAKAAQSPPTIIASPPPDTPPPPPIYIYPPQNPFVRPHPHPKPPPPQPGTYSCNVFRCYDGKGNTWSIP